MYCTFSRVDGGFLRQTLSGTCGWGDTLRGSGREKDHRVILERGYDMVKVGKGAGVSPFSSSEEGQIGNDQIIYCVRGTEIGSFPPRM